MCFILLKIVIHTTQNMEKEIGSNHSENKGSFPKFRFYHYTNLNKLISFYSFWNIYGSLMISGGMQVN